MSLGIPSYFGAYVGPFVEIRIFYNAQITENRNRRVQPMGEKQSLSEPYRAPHSPIQINILTMHLVKHGEEITITRHGKQVARLVPVRPTHNQEAYAAIH
jgi:hypothetical protein